MHLNRIIFVVVLIAIAITMGSSIYNCAIGNAEWFGLNEIQK